jgi:hypothetical protein
MNPSYFLAGNGTGGQAMDNKKYRIKSSQLAHVE